MGKHKGGKGGVVVNIASILGLVNTSIVPIYAATKHAVVSFVRSLEVILRLIQHYDKKFVSV